MALVLAMQEGRSFYLDDVQVEIMGRGAPGTVKVKVHGPMDNIMVLSDRERLELIPGVYAQIGLGSSPSMLKVVLEAPRSVRILRDTLYEENKAKSA